LAFNVKHRELKISSQANYKLHVTKSKKQNYLNLCLLDFSGLRVSMVQICARRIHVALQKELYDTLWIPPPPVEQDFKSCLGILSLWTCRSCCAKCCRVWNCHKTSGTYRLVSSYFSYEYMPWETKIPSFRKYRPWKPEKLHSQCCIEPLFISH